MSGWSFDFDSEAAARFAASRVEDTFSVSAPAVVGRRVVFAAGQDTAETRAFVLGIKDAMIWAQARLEGT